MLIAIFLILLQILLTNVAGMNYESLKLNFLHSVVIIDVQACLRTS